MSVDFRVVATVGSGYALVLLLLVLIRPSKPNGSGMDDTSATPGSGAHALEKERQQKRASLHHTVGDVNVKEMVQHAWRGYYAAAAGADEVHPVSNRSNNRWGFTALTAFDSLSTLLLLGLNDEFLEAADLALSQCSKAFGPSASQTANVYRGEFTLSVFETTIRHLGAVLSAYSQTEDRRFLSCAEDIARSLMPAFGTPTGLLHHGVVMGTQRSSNEGWTGHRSILSEVGSVQLEFRYLSHVTRNEEYGNAANVFTQHLQSALANGWPTNHSLYEDDAFVMPHKGLWPVFINPDNGLFSGAASVASLSDSFYEYLLKQWIMFGKQDDHLLEMYEDAVEGILSELLKYTPKTHHAFVGSVGIGFEATMDHLACFVPGMLTLGVMHGAHRHSKRAGRTWGDDDVIAAAVDLAATCYRMYLESPIGIGPEIVQFHTNGTYSVVHPKYILRPETVESLFYLYRYTGELMYREWASDIAQHIDKHCRTPVAFSALDSVLDPTPRQSDSMESFFLAETLKYLWLALEADDDALPLDKFVLNTEAHPLPILATNKVPRKQGETHA